MQRLGGKTIYNARHTGCRARLFVRFAQHLQCGKWPFKNKKGRLHSRPFLLYNNIMNIFSYRKTS